MIFDTVIDTARFKITVLFPKVYQYFPDTIHATSDRVNHITIKEVLSCNMSWMFSIFSQNESIGLYSLIIKKNGFDLLKNSDNYTMIIRY